MGRKVMIMLVIMILLVACGVQVTDYAEPKEYTSIEAAADYAEPVADGAPEEEYTPEPRESPEPIICVTTMRLNENMPEFTFRRIVGDYVMEDARGDEWGWGWGDEDREVSIVIEDDAGNFIQEITGLTQRDLSRGLESEGFQLRFADFNFDGYLDMYLARITPSGTMMFIYRYYWLWDSAQGQFVPNEQLPSIGSVYSVYANQETRQIEVRVRAHAVQHFLYIHEYHDGEFVHISTTERDGWGDDLVITHTDEVTGEVTVEIIPNFREGDEEQ